MMCKTGGNKLLRIGTFNCRGGLKSELKKIQIADDMDQYNMDVMALQETHIKEADIIKIKSRNGNNYQIYNAGESHDGRCYGGVGFVFREDYYVEFQKISDRICMLTTSNERTHTAGKPGPSPVQEKPSLFSRPSLAIGTNRKLIIICAYAPTLPISEKNPEIRDSFYSDLDNLINSISKRHILILTGDFNAKTGSGYNIYQNNMGKFGKGILNSNGEHLLDLANRNELILTNTTFNHKMAHRTTWVCPERKNTTRINPIRNQIDYIIVRKEHMIFVNDARSYSGTNANSDHRLVMAKLNINWNKKITKHTRCRKIDFDKLRNTDTRQKYAERVDEKLAKTKDQKLNTQEKWTNIVTACKEASEEVLGFMERSKKRRIGENEEIQKLSKEQKDIRLQINATKSHGKRQELQKKRNIKMKEIHRKIKIEESKRLLEDIKDIEDSKDDSTKMFKALRKMTRNKPKTSIIVDGENGQTTNEQDAADIITNFFEKCFNADNQTDIPNMKPTEMKAPFSETEVKDAIDSLKNNKSPGIDDIVAEQLKYGPNTIQNGIADLLNDIAKTGEYPIEIKEGILIPIPKPGKTKGPVGNLRPIILLSMIRKILAICLIRRIHDKLNEHIPVSQAAYRGGRSTTELVFTVKTLAEKAITSYSYETFILLLDMSKAFDTVDRGKLFEDLSKILNDDELHLISILIKDVELVVRCGKSEGTKFKTNIGMAQGDCLSPVLFTLYLARALEVDNNKSSCTADHTYAKINPTSESILPPHLRDHNYSIKQENNITIDQQYADDIGWITNSQYKTTQVKQNIPKKLEERNLQVNQSKTEEYIIKRNGDEKWKKCKYLGSLLDTENDIKRRKQLAMVAFNQYKHSLTSKHIELKTRIRILNAYITSIFLYNSELWTLTKSQENTIDVFQRNLLRKIIKIKWPYTIRNEDLYERTQETKWTEKIKKRRLKWLGHMMRLPETSPAHLAIKEAIRPVKRPRGKPKTTWISMINKDIKEMNLKMGSPELFQAAADRRLWKTLVEGVCAEPTNGVQAS